MIRTVREMLNVEIDLIINYFLTASPEFLKGMGVDTDKLPDKDKWKETIRTDFILPIEKRKFYYLLWLVDDIPVGHSNINDIVFGKQAYMHLHIWQTNNRQKGNGSFFVKHSLPFYFSKFNLKKLYCQPYALNPAPNSILQKAGFQFIKKYETTGKFVGF